MSDKSKKVIVWPLYLMFLVLFIVSLVSYTMNLWSFAIVTGCISVILFLLAGFSQLIENYPDYRIYYFTILITLSAPLAIYSLVLIAKATKGGLIQVGLSGDWIGFAGSIIGGAMTLFAVIFTVNHERLVRDDDIKRNELQSISEKSQKFMPIIEICEQRIENSFFTKKINGSNGSGYFFSITNVSENHAREVDIKLIGYTAFDKHNKKVELPSNADSKIKTIKILPSMKSNEFYVMLTSNQLDQSYPAVFNQTEIKLTLTIRIELFDIHKISSHVFITKVNGTFHENLYDPILFYLGDNKEMDIELYNRIDLIVHSCITDIE